MRVLLVEDNHKLVASISRGLEEEGFTIATADTAAGGRSLARSTGVDAMILDLGLPDGDGISVLRDTRGAHVRCPILVLTARDAVESRVTALDAGADDYVVKPFAFDELVARLRALVRRAAQPRWASLTVGDIVLADDLRVHVGARAIVLSPREHGLLGCLLRRRGEIVSRGELLRDAFGYSFDPGTNVIDVHLAHIRRKLAGTPIAVETIRGVGFRLVVDEP